MSFVRQWDQSQPGAYLRTVSVHNLSLYDEIYGFVRAD
jgi:hypothetical protein